MENFRLKREELQKFRMNENVDIEKYCFFIAPKDDSKLSNFYILANKQSFKNAFNYLSIEENNLKLLEKYYDKDEELEILFMTNNSKNPIFYGTIETYLKIKNNDL